MITIHTGFFAKEEIPFDAESVRNMVDYVSARQFILDALSRNEDADIYIMTRICDDWFWDLNDYKEDVQILDDSPEKRLMRKCSVSSLPPELVENPRLILEWDLLVLPDPDQRIADVLDWIIRHKLSDVWTVEHPSPEHLTELVSWYAEYGQAMDPVLRQIAAPCGEQWIRAATGKLRSAYARFLESPDDKAGGLLAWSALTSYDPALREQWLAQHGWYSANHEDLVDALKKPVALPKAVRQKLNSILMTYWNKRLSEIFDDRGT